MTKRLSKQDWLRAGFAALAESGPEALKAEPLARRLGTTKGSFYWHFHDVAGFHAALLSEWGTQAQTHLKAQGRAHGTPVQKLRNLAGIADLAPGAEAALRVWARGTPAVASALARVDQSRMRYLESLLAEIGLSNPEITRLLYAAFLGMAALPPDESASNDAALGTLVDLILALSETE